MPEDTGYADSGPSTDRDKNKLLDRFEKQIRRCEGNWRDEFREIKRNRRLLEGEIPESVPRHGGDVGLVDSSGYPIDGGGVGTEKVRANLLLATNEAMLPLVYARNPDVSVRPAEQVTGPGREYHEQLKGWSETLELVVSKQLTKGGLKKQAKKAVRSIQAAKVGWLKVSYQREYGQDPEILNRMHDIQDNLREIEGRIAQMAEDDATAEEEELRAQELRQMITGLEQSPEVVLNEGIVVDHIPTEHMRMDPGVSLLEDYTQADWLAHYVELSVDDYQRRFGINDENMRGVKIFRKRPSGDGYEARTFSADRGTGTEDADEIVRLWELWHRRDNTVYQWCEGAMDFAREPWVPQGMGERWFPFWCIGFHWVDGQAWPQSPVDLLEGLQQEYNDTREQKTEHRKANVPHYIASADAEPDTVRSFTVAGAREVVLIDAGGRPLNQIFAPSPSVPMNPAMYDTTDTRFDMQWVSGVQDAARGGVVKAKTLGEAEIAENHLASRASNFQDELEEALTEISEYVAQMCLQKMDPATVRKIAGEHAVWPEMPRGDVFDLFDIEIRAGSTGKPDKRAEQEQWSEMLPHILEITMKILEMRAQGITDEANPLVPIFEETLKRFDERLDIEHFLPANQQMQPGQPGQPGQGQPGQPGQGQPPPGMQPGNVTQFQQPPG